MEVKGCPSAVSSSLEVGVPQDAKGIYQFNSNDKKRRSMAKAKVRNQKRDLRKEKGQTDPHLEDRLQKGNQKEKGKLS